ncbi:hypothetical protein [Priestia megaterium]|uniref:hypothetical protein n=1 Tax=Priestia megaterium TaxID=1404 RepID=UPI002FFEA48F
MKQYCDPHLETSSVKADKLDLENGDIYLFKQMITKVDNNNFFVMVTHIKYPAYDKKTRQVFHQLLSKSYCVNSLGITDLW